MQRCQPKLCPWLQGGGAALHNINLFYNLPAFNYVLEDTARYAGLLLTPAEGFGLRLRLFSPSDRKKSPYFAVLDHFRIFLVSSRNFAPDYKGGVVTTYNICLIDRLPAFNYVCMYVY